jgi:transcription elongation factor GreA
LFYFFKNTAIMSQVTYVTKETLDQMQAELKELKSSGRSNIAKAIAEAREKGDLKENAEYDAAKEAQGMHEAKIAKLENAVANSRIIDPKDIDISKVTILSKVKIQNLKNNKSLTYQIVSENEADLKEKKISVTSPIAAALLGKAVGDSVDVETPGGVLQFKIEHISI